MQRSSVPRRAMLAASVALSVIACGQPSALPPDVPLPPNDSRFTVTVEPVSIPGLPALHSFALGEADGKWLVVAGRTDGLHKRRPFEAFLASGNNTSMYVIDVASAQVWSASVEALSPSLAEQLQSTNTQFEQRADVLYIAGGYGYSPTVGDHITHGALAAIDVRATIEAIINGTELTPHIRQLADERLAVTGGSLGLLNGTFYLAGGQRFMGRYNPMGPNHGPGFVQEYTNEIRRFRIEDDGVTLGVTDFAAWHDDENLHRRDYNLVPQIFPNGSLGFTMFTGVFQYEQNVPWLNLVDIKASGHRVVPTFQQLLSQYHTAHAALFDPARNEMHTIFFGGMAQFFYDAAGVLKQDDQVPFVRTISMVTRFANDVLREVVLGEMPTLLGASGEFIPGPSVETESNGVQRLAQLPPEGTVLGYILGGIESTAPNVFFSNEANPSVASGQLYRVTLRE